MSTRRVWTAVLFCFIAGHGVLQQTRGALLPVFETEFIVTQDLLGLVGPAGTVGLLTAVMVVGMRSGSLDIRRMLGIGMVAVVACSFVISLTSSFAAVLLLLLIQGLGLGIVRGLDRPLLSHLYPETRARMFNLYGLLWALGATAGPLLVNAVLANGDWRLMYVLVGVALVPLLVLLWRLELPEATWSEETISLAGLRTVLHRPAILGMVAALLCSGFVEGTVFTWLPFFATQFLPRETANVLLSSFLVMYIPGRLVYSVLADRLGHLELVALVGLGSLPLLVLAFVFRVETVLLPVVMGLGFFIAGFFPTLSAFGMDAAPGFSGPVNAIATGANFVGITVGPFVVGLLAARFGISDAMPILVLVMGALVVVTATTYVAVGRSGAAGVADVV
ncbi:MFS transporter [Haloarchaeobius amylolyticus]|uniref:MFS transporter n=1 Tax=Haloarchaeobius amylolyticus TaxID=1198296 RepID=UPI00226E4630|nr:MFS transporter [Haloarchaeobius amylolyticus]